MDQAGLKCCVLALGACWTTYHCQLVQVELYHVWWDFDTDTFPPLSLLTYSHHGGILSWWEFAGKPWWWRRWWSAGWWWWERYMGHGVWMSALGSRAESVSDQLRQSCQCNVILSSSTLPCNILCGHLLSYYCNVFSEGVTKCLGYLIQNGNMMVEYNMIPGCSSAK